MGGSSSCPGPVPVGARRCRAVQLPAPAGGRGFARRGPDGRSPLAVPASSGREREAPVALHLPPLAPQPGRAGKQPRVCRAGRAPVSSSLPSRGSGGGETPPPPTPVPPAPPLFHFALGLCRWHHISPHSAAAGGSVMGGSAAWTPPCATY